MTLKTSPQVQRIIIRCQWMDALMTVNSGEMVCTTKSDCPPDGLTSSEIVASPPRPHVGQLRTKATTGIGAIHAVWANGPLAGCLKFVHIVVCLGFELLVTLGGLSIQAQRISICLLVTRFEPMGNHRWVRDGGWVGGVPQFGYQRRCERVRAEETAEVLEQSQVCGREGGTNPA
jgi:hypothetical protein